MENLYKLEIFNNFLAMTPKAQATNKKIDWIRTKIKNFCASKVIIKRVKKTTHRMGKKFANHVTDKRFLSKVYKKPTIQWQQ